MEEKLRVCFFVLPTASAPGWYTAVCGMSLPFGSSFFSWFRVGFGTHTTPHPAAPARAAPPSECRFVGPRERDPPRFRYGRLGFASSLAGWGSHTLDIRGLAVNVNKRRRG